MFEKKEMLLATIFEHVVSDLVLQVGGDVVVDSAEEACSERWQMAHYGGDSSLEPAARSRSGRIPTRD